MPEPYLHWQAWFHPRPSERALTTRAYGVRAASVLIN